MENTNLVDHTLEPEELHIAEKALLSDDSREENNHSEQYCAKIKCFLTVSLHYLKVSWYHLSVGVQMRKLRMRSSSQQIFLPSNEALCLGKLKREGKRES